ncbi:MAG: hypothetical protein ACJ8FU_17435, partial [Xanthobacteraceae bacterium]
LDGGAGRGRKKEQQCGGSGDAAHRRAQGTSSRVCSPISCHLKMPSESLELCSDHYASTIGIAPAIEPCP